MREIGIGCEYGNAKGGIAGFVFYGASHRPAAIDTHFFGNASVVRTGRLNYAADIKTMADVLDVPRRKFASSRLSPGSSATCDRETCTRAG